MDREFLLGPSGGVGPCCPQGNRAGDGMARFVSEEKATAPQPGQIQLSSSKKRYSFRRPAFSMWISRLIFFRSKQLWRCAQTVHLRGCRLAAGGAAAVPALPNLRLLVLLFDPCPPGEQRCNSPEFFSVMLFQCANGDAQTGPACLIHQHCGHAHLPDAARTGQQQRNGC